MENTQFSDPDDPLVATLVAVLSAGYMLRSMNHLNKILKGGLKDGLILLEMLYGGDNSPSVVQQLGRSVSDISASLGMPRESSRRQLQTLASDGWLNVDERCLFSVARQTRDWFERELDGGDVTEFLWIASQVANLLDMTSPGVDALTCEKIWHTAMVTRHEDLTHPPWLEAKDKLAMKLRGAPSNWNPKSRVNAFLYRHLKLLYRTFYRDLMLPLLIGEIAHRNISMLAYQNRFPDNATRIMERLSLRVPIIADELMPCNSYSLSLSLGIPEPTVRRKIKTLIQHGWIASAANRSLTIKSDEIKVHTFELDAATRADMMVTYLSLCE